MNDPFVTLYAMLKNKKKINLKVFFLGSMLLQGALLEGALHFRDEEVENIFKNVTKKRGMSFKNFILHGSLKQSPKNPSLFSLEQKREGGNVTKLKESLKAYKTFLTPYGHFFSANMMNIKIYKLQVSAVEKLDQKFKNNPQKIKKEDISSLYEETSEKIEIIEKETVYEGKGTISRFIRHRYLFDTPDFRQAAIKFWVIVVLSVVSVISLMVSGFFYLKKSLQKKKEKKAQKEEAPDEKLEVVRVN